jgi:hypothetical protein
MARDEYREGSFKGGECPQKDLLILEAHERVRKNRKIVHLEKK